MAEVQTRRSRKRQRTRGEILAAAARLVVDRDLGDLSVAAICQEADVARATFFLHFEAKPTVLTAWEAGLVERLEAASRNCGPRAVAVYRSMAEVLWHEPGVSRCVILAALRSAEPGPLEAWVTTRLERLQREGELRGGTRPGLLARAWLAGAAGVLGTTEGRRGDGALRDELVRLALSGVAEKKPRLKWTPPTAGASHAL